MNIEIAGRDIEWYVPILAAVTIGYLICVVDVTNPYEPGGLLSFQRSELSGFLLDLVLFVPPFTLGVLQDSRRLRSLVEWLTVSTLFPWIIWLAVLSRGYHVSHLGGAPRDEIGGPLFPLGYSEGALRWGAALYLAGLLVGTAARTVSRRVRD